MRKESTSFNIDDLIGSDFPNFLLFVENKPTTRLVEVKFTSYEELMQIPRVKKTMEEYAFNRVIQVVSKSSYSEEESISLYADDGRMKQRIGRLNNSLSKLVTFRQEKIGERYIILDENYLSSRRGKIRYSENKRFTIEKKTSNFILFDTKLNKEIGKFKSRRQIRVGLFNYLDVYG